MATSFAEEEPNFEAVLPAFQRRDQLDPAAGAGRDRLCDGEPESSAVCPRRSCARRRVAAALRAAGVPEARLREYAAAWQRHALAFPERERFAALHREGQLTSAEAAQVLGVSTKTLGRLRRERGLPAHEPAPGMVRYRRSEIDTWMQQRSGT